MVYWVDYMVEKIIRERGDKEEYVVESGIILSGYVYIGNFCEFFIVYIVGYVFRDRGKRVRYIYMWDDYDCFRKVFKNVLFEWKEYFMKLVCEVLDFWGCYESYVDYFMSFFEEEILKFGIEVDFFYVSELYKSGEYVKEIRFVFEKRDEIKVIFDKYCERVK